MKRALMMSALVAAACSPESPDAEPHILLYVTTDAPLPAPPGAAREEPAALFDRLRIELFPPGASRACAGCTREFAIQRDVVNAGQASIGIVVQQAGVRARVRLYRGGGTASGEPRPGSTLESVLELPGLPSAGAIELSVILATDDLLRPRGTLDSPVSPLPGTPPLDLSGTWWGAAAAGCHSAPQAGEVCVPGGPHWMGDPTLDSTAAPEIDGQLERLVVLAPFFLDRTEVTVDRFRASGLASSLTPGGPADNPHEAGPGFVFCTYTSATGPNESHPVNCLSWTRAREYCQTLGQRLPTEAELDYAATARGRSPFVWGHTEPACPDAVFDRNQPTSRCGAFGVGPQPVGSGDKDRVLFEGGELVDLAGNVAEWAADRWNREDEPCWGSGIFVDPQCQDVSPSDGFGRVVRGGHFDDSGSSLRAAYRTWLANEERAVSNKVGFRCARSQ